MWTLGSYDLLAIYPESTAPATGVSEGGSYFAPELSTAIKAHNVAVAAANKAAMLGGGQGV